MRVFAMRTQHMLKEMIALDQWVCVKDAYNKTPYTVAGSPADVTQPHTWSSYEAVLAAPFKHFGFVLTAKDPFTIIDLDEPANEEQKQRHLKIFNMFQSYAENSISGKGVHIIVKGRIPFSVHRDNVEIYSTERYMVTTQQTIRHLPIMDYQDLLDRIVKEMYPQKRYEFAEDKEQILEDREVIAMATRAANREKLMLLVSGRWEGDYPSQSEADYALLNILAFYSKNNAQVKRLFRSTALGKREKATKNDKYLDICIKNIRSEELPPICFDIVEKAFNQ